MMSSDPPRRENSTAALLLGIVVTPLAGVVSVVIGLDCLAVWQSSGRMDAAWFPLIICGHFLVPAGVVAVVIGIRNSVARRRKRPAHGNPQDSLVESG